MRLGVGALVEGGRYQARVSADYSNANLLNRLVRLNWDNDIGYAVPKEGGLLWQDCLCVPKGAPHPGNAHKFINYILDAAPGAAIADFIQYATPNKAAKALLPESYRNNPAIFPPDSVVKVSESAIYLGEKHQQLMDETWTRIQAA